MGSDRLDSVHRQQSQWGPRSRSHSRSTSRLSQTPEVQQPRRHSECAERLCAFQILLKEAKMSAIWHFDFHRPPRTHAWLILQDLQHVGLAACRPAQRQQYAMWVRHTHSHCLHSARARQSRAAKTRHHTSCQRPQLYAVSNFAGSTARQQHLGGPSGCWGTTGVNAMGRRAQSRTG